MRLMNKSAVIVGVGPGMGNAIATLFAQEGANVALIARKIDNIRPIEQKIKQMGRKALAIVGNATEEQDLHSASQNILEAFGDMHILVLLPGGGFRYTSDLIDTDQNSFQFMLNNHLISLFNASKAFIPHMRSSGGSVITISAANTVMRDGMTAYSTVKQGVIGFSKNLAREVYKYNIRVNVLSPGLIRQPISEGTIDLPNEMLDRKGQPEDIAYGALYFASDESRWVTGQELVVDGGADIFVKRERIFD